MGLDRYQTVTWRLRYDAARGLGLFVRGRVKPYAPPFMMLGVNLENTNLERLPHHGDSPLSGV